MTEVLAHPATAPVNAADLRAETCQDHDEPWQENWPDGTTRRLIGQDPDSGGLVAFLTFPAGYEREAEVIHEEFGVPRFECHSCHEEVLVVAGEYAFGVAPQFNFSSPAYLNHPGGWLHPAHQLTREGCTLFIRNSKEPDFTFEPIPEPWDGQGYYSDEFSPSPSRVVPIVHLDPADVVDEDDAAGWRSQLLWTDEVAGWRTWLIQLPVGYQDPRPQLAVGGGEEWLVLDGELSTVGLAGEVGDGPDLLTRHGYLCDPEVTRSGWVASRTGATAIRWERTGRST